jgi:hypothetical protein
MAAGDRSLFVFVAALGGTVAVLAALASFLSGLVHWAFFTMWSVVLLGIGGAYVCSSLLAWTGFSNLYRVSPTLFVGLRSYRQVVLRGQVFREGRDTEALVRGLAFGGSLMGIGAALSEPLFIFVDAVAVVAVIIFLLLVRAPGVRLRT